MKSFEEKWQGFLTILKFGQTNIIDSYYDQKNQKNIRGRLSKINVVSGINDLLKDNDIRALKRQFSYASMIDEYCFITYNNNWPYWDMKPYTYAIISDNTSLIERFANLPIDEHLIYDDPKKGMPCHFNYTFQGLLKNDEVQVERGLKLWNKDIEKRKAIRWARAHIACIEAIMSKDLNKIKEALLLFEDNRLKSNFIKNDICENVISFFPIAYTKIAWLKGLEVDPESKYMPVELLEVNPLEEYTIPYWFLRDYYREQGVEWRYDPIHPELQDWDNDPENPNRKRGFMKKLFGK